MPWKLVPPRKGKSPFYYVRGTYCGLKLDKSTGTGEREAAARILATWRKRAERGELSAEPSRTFVSAAIAYMQAGGERKFLTPILKAWPAKTLDEIDQIAVDTLADELYPKGSPATRSRQVYTPVSAVLKRAGIERIIKRPIGSSGTARTFWLRPEEAFRLLDEAAVVKPEFGTLCTLLLYSGLRLGEALAMEWGQVELAREFAYVPDTKTGEPRAVYLPPIVVAALSNQPDGLANRSGRVFRFHKGGWLYDALDSAAGRAGIALPPRTAFHVFRHTYGTWMRQFGGLDDLGLTRTGVWADRDSVARYSHSEPTVEARAAANLPIRGLGVETKKRTA